MDVDCPKPRSWVQSGRWFSDLEERSSSDHLDTLLRVDRDRSCDLPGLWTKAFGAREFMNHTAGSDRTPACACRCGASVSVAARMWTPIATRREGSSGRTQRCRGRPATGLRRAIQNANAHPIAEHAIGVARTSRSDGEGR
jgi:predicted component of type VI protein secretion system